MHKCLKNPNPENCVTEVFTFLSGSVKRGIFINILIVNILKINIIKSTKFYLPVQNCRQKDTATTSKLHYIELTTMQQKISIHCIRYQQQNIIQ